MTVFLAVLHSTRFSLPSVLHKPTALAHITHIHSVYLKVFMNIVLCIVLL